MRGTNTVSDVNANQSRVIRCYNCKGGGHIAKQCTAKKRVKDAEWLEETNDYDDLQLHTTSNFKVDHVDAYDSDCDDEATACAIFMASLSPARSTSGDTTGLTYDSELLYEINGLKAQLQEKSIVVNELKQLLATLKENSQVTLDEYINPDSRFQIVEDENVSLAFQVSSLVKEREHIKLEYKKLYDSIKQTRAQNKLTTDSLQQRFNDQIFENAMLRAKLQVKFSEPQLNQNGASSEQINAYFKNNRAVHHDYLKVTKEHLETLQELLEQARALNPTDANIDYAHKFAQRNQELLVYVSASCPFTFSGNEKWASATSHKRNNKPCVDTLGRLSYTNASGS
ncbi:retrovirus-related pol polyprotein from transposon TNT 1-94 [Tanacetum coccineum]